MTNAALIVAAGQGSRTGEPIPKQYLSLNGQSVLTRTIRCFLNIPRIHHVLCVISADADDQYMGATTAISNPRLLPPVHGGDTRATSVRNGLEALTSVDPAKVLIHDAARPFVSGETITAVLDALETTDGACAALPIVDALWQAEDGRAIASVDRDALWRAQTPQGFRFGSILAAHRQHDGTGTDDVAVAREAGVDVALVLGEEANFKITTPADLKRAERKAKRQDE
ncbi:MAG: 2-C-methyl-D-erythritol 4-phosphate cytidylyltransferase [Paracoccaceae bacterium]|nr:2-C-methyl-D-erythritol 4-phosphate cytidylyltransferase [Paracoccaceae bacterium]